MRRSFGRLIVRGKFLSKPLFTNITTTRTISSRIQGSSVFPTIFNSLHFSGCSGSRYYHAEVETEEGFDSEFKRSITKGDTINLNDLLFTSDRDYLVRNNGQHVKAGQLEGKVIGIYFVPILAKDPRNSGPLSDNDPRHVGRYTAVLKEIYNELHPLNNFETVVVACNDHVNNTRDHQDLQKVFHDLFSSMPWTAIPFSDVTSRIHVQRSFGETKEYAFPTIYFVDQTGMVLQYFSWRNLEYYGSLGYPFSDERLEILRTEDYLASQQPSLKALLGSPQRDYVISNNGDKVPIHTFKDKVVALYFYQPDHLDLLTEELKLAYEEYAKKKKIFEVVLVYIHESNKKYRGSKGLFYKNEESFWKKFKTMPWLALPFKDMSCKKLMRVFDLKPDDAFLPSLVIFDPQAEYIEPLADIMLRKYGIGGYPFTRERAAELENKKIKDLKPEMIWEPNIVFSRNDGSQVPLSELVGKRVILVLETFDVSHRINDGSLEVKSKAEFLTMLKEQYLQKKGTDDEFEVIRVVLGNTESSVTKHLVGDMPWLVSRGKKLMHELGSSYFWYGSPTYYLLENHNPILAFSSDGKLVRKTMYPTFETSKFPFYAGSLEEETLSQFDTLRVFDCWGFDDFNREFFQYNGRIFYT